MDGLRLKFCAAVLLAGAVMPLPLAHAQSGDRSRAGEHVVTTWATAQPLAPTSPMAGPGGPPQPGRGPAGRGGRGPAPLPTSFTNQSVRMILRTSIGGRRVRVQLSNMTTA